MGTCIWPVKPEERKCKYCKLVHCEERNREGVRKLGTVTPTMRSMEVGQRIEIDAINQNATRTAAYRLKKERGWRFSVYIRNRSVFVERIS